MTSSADAMPRPEQQYSSSKSLSLLQRIAHTTAHTVQPHCTCNTTLGCKLD